MSNIELIDLLEREEYLSPEQWARLIAEFDMEDLEYAAVRARAVSKEYFGNTVFVRGLIEFANCCKNDCYYCGIRKSNERAERYRLTKNEILNCCETGYELGIRTFVLQGGDDPYYTDEMLCEIVREIKQSYPDCAVTLSVGERKTASYQAFFDAGADRYLLRHESADAAHYRTLHPAGMELESRKNCLDALKSIGFQTGCGFMVGTPGQTPLHLAADMELIKELSPQMVGLGPFIPHENTPFADEPAGASELTLFLLSLVRLMTKNVLLPATTALATVDAGGYEKGILAGANVLMPNLSPPGVRDRYLLYNNKSRTGGDAAEGFKTLKQRISNIGYQLVTDRGDWSPGKKDKEQNERGKGNVL